MPEEDVGFKKVATARNQVKVRWVRSGVDRRRSAVRIERVIGPGEDMEFSE